MKESKLTKACSNNSLIGRNNSSQNELTLPRINELINCVKKNTIKVDSGKEKDLVLDKSTESFKYKNNWTLSSNCSDDFQNIFFNSAVRKQNDNVTIELLPAKENLKKNRTSSTLLSYGIF